MLDINTYKKLIINITRRLLDFDKNNKEEDSLIFSHSLSSNDFKFKQISSKISNRIDSLPKISLGEYIISKIEQKGLTDPIVYKNASISRQYWNNIIRNLKKPSHEKLIRIAIALKLTPKEFEELLSLGGYAKSKISEAIYVCFEHNVYDLEDIEEILTFFELESLFSDIA